jgi:predicted ribosomally synthesized peptide with SipW-like signal peptide
MKTTRKILLSLGVLGAAASIAGLGTFATFTDSDNASHTISSGTVDVNLGAVGANNRLTVGASGLVPGDTLQRRVKLSNAGTENLASVKLTTVATTSSVLDTDATSGLQMVIERCTNGIGWSESGPPYTYTCDLAVAGDGLGTKATVLASQRVIGADLTLANLSATTAGNTDDLRVTITLPSGAGNGFQNKTSTIQYTFNAEQRAATNK